MNRFHLLIFLTCFTFFNEGNGTIEQRITVAHCESVVSSKKHFKKQNKKNRKLKRFKKKLNNYDDFDYNILLLITYGIILAALVFALFGSLFSLLLLAVSGLLLLICISNGANKSAWWALGFVALIFYPIYFANREYD